MPWLEQLRSTDWVQASCVVLGAYALGCLATGYYLVRWRTGQDVRRLGSGSVGAKNVGRFLGATGFCVTVLGDFAKGALAVWAAHRLRVDDRMVMLAMVAVVAGHVWPAQLRFRGGKGMATSVGALLIFDYHLAIAFALLFAGAFAVLRKTVLPGLFSLACVPVVSACLDHDPGKTIGLSCLAGVVLFAHRKNLAAEIRTLTERHYGQPKQNPPEQ